MGWSTGTDIFDTVAEHLLDAEADLNVTQRVLEHLYDIMSGRFDWDTQNESKFWEHPLVGKILGNDQLPLIEKPREIITTGQCPDWLNPRNLLEEEDPLLGSDDEIRKFDVSLFAAQPGSYMDLRDYFAAAALTGLMSKPITHNSQFGHRVRLSFGLADSMLKQRKKARQE